MKPGPDCRLYQIGGAIDAVDWVALASLRDSENSFFDYDEVTDKAGGITPPHSVTSWFRAAGFGDVKNRTNVVTDKGLRTLIDASMEFSAGKAVCLFVGSDVLKKPRGGNNVFAEHWVGLTSSVSVGSASAGTLAGRGPKVDDDDQLLSAATTFTVFTWGNGSYPADRFRKPLITRDFLDYFYGFVSAR